MAWWTNLLRIKIFVNPTQLCITHEKSGGLHLAESGLMAGRQADESWTGFDILKACCGSKYLIFCFA